MAEEETKKEGLTLDDVYDDKNIVGDSDDDKPGKKRRFKRKRNVALKCPLCESGVKSVSYKDIYQLKKFTSVRGKLISSDKSGVCTEHQRHLAKAIKRARYIGLLPYVSI